MHGDGLSSNQPGNSVDKKPVITELYFPPPGQYEIETENDVELPPFERHHQCFEPLYRENMLCRSLDGVHQAFSFWEASSHSKVTLAPSKQRVTTIQCTDLGIGQPAISQNKIELIDDDIGVEPLPLAPLADDTFRSDHNGDVGGRNGPTFFQAHRSLLQVSPEDKLLPNTLTRDDRVKKKDLVIMKKNRKKPDRIRKLAFPRKLYLMIEYAESNDLYDVLSWLPCGQVFIIKDPRRLEIEILSVFMRSEHMTSFHRQLNLYGFKRYDPARFEGAFRHENFVKLEPQKLTLIKRKRRKSEGPIRRPRQYMTPSLPEK